MDFDKQWHDGVRRVSAAFSALPEPELERVRRLGSLMMEQKGAMQALVAQVDAASHCAGCGGACCVAGKYHFTAVDLLVHLATGAPLFAPLFHNGLCSYLAEAGCLMAPAYRPFNCITFNCELIEDLLPEHEVARFYRLERELRRSYGEMRALFPGNSMDGALLQGETASR
ncbi:MAG: hypothetical protein A2075_02035 [Geobacteraceae bacterium GWC2_58_44]|nr:MAG: hypothetical protein A2075_02035 [Geobacteraceae bacterium GWC2_58_44]